MNIGILGGSFNPIHVGHLVIAERFTEQMQLHTCLFVPAATSPFKQDDPSAVSASHRLAMVRLAIATYPQFDVCTVELERGGISYTIDTVRAIAATHPGARVHLLIGADQAMAFQRWRDWQALLRETQVCIVRRPSLITPDEELQLAHTLTIDGVAPVWITAPLMEVSSTEIRRRVLAGEPIDDLTVDAVRDYIFLHGLYR